MHPTLGIITCLCCFPLFAIAINPPKNSSHLCANMCMSLWHKILKMGLIDIYCYVILQKLHHFILILINLCWSRSLRECACQLTLQLDSGNWRLPKPSPVLGIYIHYSHHSHSRNHFQGHSIERAMLCEAIWTEHETENR